MGFDLSLAVVGVFGWLCVLRSLCATTANLDITDFDFGTLFVKCLISMFKNEVQT